eukprot:GHVT01025480.1.p1 GENE.GHVT01025480.1~~GHVT01025480.1.p1  ORF type:complete len:225 (-),score=35.14 GHVT01025480.1:138-812(-)
MALSELGRAFAVLPCCVFADEFPTRRLLARGGSSPPSALVVPSPVPLAGESFSRGCRQAEHPPCPAAVHQPPLAPSCSEAPASSPHPTRESPSALTAALAKLCSGLSCESQATNDKTTLSSVRPEPTCQIRNSSCKLNKEPAEDDPQAVPTVASPDGLGTGTDSMQPQPVKSYEQLLQWLKERDPLGRVQEDFLPMLGKNKVLYIPPECCDSTSTRLLLTTPPV